MFSFTLKGKTYNSDMSGTTVQTYLQEKLTWNNFARSLVEARIRWGRWTESQGMWAHKLVLDDMEANTPKAVAPVAPTVEIRLMNTVEFLNAVSTLKRVKLTFQQNGGPVCIKKNRYGNYYVTDNGVWVGTLDANGTLKDKGMGANVLAMLDELEENPKEFAAKEGKKSGQCCFCSLPLTDERSVKVGYGPICAGHYKLPWGE